MPLHDWSDSAGWEGMHHLWIAELLRWIKPRLPIGYRAYIGSSPLLAVGAPVERPDVGVRSWSAEPAQEPAGPLLDERNRPRTNPMKRSPWRRSTRRRRSSSSGRAA